MSQHSGGSNMNAVMRLYEKDFVLEFHKGFVLNEKQYEEVVGLLKQHDIDGIEALLQANFPDDVEIVRSILDHQRQLIESGHYVN